MSDLGKKPDRLDGFDAELDALFSEARAVSGAPTSDLMARVLADAASMQPPEPQAVVHAAVHTASAKTGLMAQLLASLGGWAGLASLSAATVAGVWIGVAGPETLTDPLFAVLGTESAFEAFDGASSFDFTAFEG